MQTPVLVFDHIRKTVKTFQPGPQLNELLASSATVATSGRPNKT
jgi:hypothetical protein